jgi:hypothetical protein
MLVVAFDEKFILNKEAKGIFSLSDIYDQEMIQIARDTF